MIETQNFNASTAMRKLTITTLFLAVWLSSCTHYYYVANVQNVPLFREKNEFRLSGAYGFGDYSNCAEVQAAYSLTKNIGIMTNFMSAKGGHVSDSTNWGKGSYFEGAIGYYKPLGKYSVFEIYGGLGGGNQHHQYAITEYFPRNITFYCGTSALSFTKLFVQPSFGLAFKGFDVAFSTRLCSLSFNNINNQINSQTDESEYDNLNSIAHNKRYMFLEPALTIRGGWKNVKVQFQAAAANVFDKQDLFFVEQPHISIGLYIAIAERYK
ncbi:MAG TPA: hypothetical protein VIK14_03125 [Ignavibacteria bacterium]